MSTFSTDQPIPVSNALLRTLSNGTGVRAFSDGRSIALGYELGMIATKPAERGPKPVFAKYTAGESSRFHRLYGGDPARYAAMQKQRNYGSSNPLPPALRYLFTRSELSALAIIGQEVKKSGACTLSNAAIAGRAGCGLSTVKNALREAKCLGLVHVVYRPVRGQRNLPNIVTIISEEWTLWLKRSSIGVKKVAGLKKVRDRTSNTVPVASLARAYEGEQGQAFRLNERGRDGFVRPSRGTWMPSRTNADGGRR